ncbi:hypothetical protein [Micromonospora sp. HK10]|uniref:hypothetical protein n=1 Tax=Micromonospora sp. HK10 TaxID=1538294 RepID=UPI0012E2BD0D|nr:hypothetical protein [Micromonospora sp. HK10]
MEFDQNVERVDLLGVGEPDRWLGVESLVVGHRVILRERSTFRFEIVRTNVSYAAASVGSGIGQCVVKVGDDLDLPAGADCSPRWCRQSLIREFSDRVGAGQSIYRRRP